MYPADAAALKRPTRPAPGAEPEGGLVRYLLRRPVAMVQVNWLRLMMSRLGSDLCPNGHRVEPSVATQSMDVACPVCGVHFKPPNAESFAYNSYGACPAYKDLGVRSEVDVTTLVPDPAKTILEGAVLPWNSEGDGCRCTPPASSGFASTCPTDP